MSKPNLSEVSTVEVRLNHELGVLSHRKRNPSELFQKGVRAALCSALRAR